MEQYQSGDGFPPRSQNMQIYWYRQKTLVVRSAGRTGGDDREPPAPTRPETFPLESIMITNCEGMPGGS